MRVFVFVFATSRWTPVLSSFRPCMICWMRCSNHENIHVLMMIGLVTEGEGKSHCKVGTLWVRQLSVASFPVTNLSDTSAGGQRLESSMTSFSNFLFINFLVINFLIINLLFINFLFINRETVTLSIPKSPELAHLLFFTFCSSCLASSLGPSQWWQTNN